MINTSSPTKKQIAMLLHLIIFLSTVWAIGIYFFSADFQPDLTGIRCLRYFTTDSNILAAVSSALCLAFSNKKNRPRWISVFQFASTVSVSVTLLTVIFFLAPTAAVNGNGLPDALDYFAGNVFVLHFSTPGLSIVTMMITDSKGIVTKLEALWALVPIVLYSIVYLSMVVFIKSWPDWYGFTFGGHNELAPIVLLVMYSFTGALAFGERKIQQMICH